MTLCLHVLECGLLCTYVFVHVFDCACVLNSMCNYVRVYVCDYLFVIFVCLVMCVFVCGFVSGIFNMIAIARVCARSLVD